MTLALTGGTGFVGQAVLDLLEGRRERVRVLARKVPQDKRGFRWVEGSLNEPFALAHLVADAECVIHIAGLTRAVNPDHFEIVNVTGTLNVVEAAVRWPVLSIIHSSVRVWPSKTMLNSSNSVSASVGISVNTSSPSCCS